MQSRINMMCHMIAIIKGEEIVFTVDALNGQSTIVLVASLLLRHRCDRWVDENVLREIAKHHCHACNYHWHDKKPGTLTSIAIPKQSNHCQNPESFTDRNFAKTIHPTLFKC